ncbi:unnamed protein product [Caenorhabditis bovis]|uniref:Protein sleepless n=1 Tax=Caenorhabditis bovis TaxID=2654633 RepID=A0A8S1F9V4_9PELO|nr:unnamed protein product [Caenorhabditis bovis]
MRGLFNIIFISCLFAVTTALNCYICNSLKDPECVDNYESFSKVCPVKTFDGRKAVKPVGCRIIRQYIHSEYSIVRECAYSGEDVSNKSNKGSLGVSRIVTQCSDKPVCNSSSTYAILPVVLIAFYKLLH